MSKKFLSTAIMCILASGSTLFAGTYSGGNGSAAYPFLISSPADWQELTATSADWSAYFLLTNDIDLAGLTVYPVGYSPKFKGSFNGQYHKIKNLTMTASQGLSHAGLFGHAESAIIQNLTLENVNINTYSAYAGALAGRYRYGSIVNCHSSGIVATATHDTTYAGGLVGYLQDATLSDSSSDCNVTGSYWAYSYAGGLVGYLHNGAINHCYSTGTATASSNFNDACAGGLIGYLYYGQANGSYATGDAQATATSTNSTACAGGLVGRNYSTINACYSTGSADAIASTNSVAAYAGGLVGYSLGGAGIVASFSTGDAGASASPNTKAYAGGFIGYNVGYIAESYTRGNATVVGPSTSATLYVGGFAAYLQDNYNLRRCYSTGQIFAYGPYAYMGAFSAYTQNTTSNFAPTSFWDFESSDNYYNPTYYEALPLSTAEMKTITFFLNAKWDFVGESANGTNDYWRMCVNGVDYPKLNWQPVQFGDFACPDGVNSEDLAYLTANWLNSYYYPFAGADANGDKIVNLADFTIMAENWFANP